nr:unnamed protein product [Digitaria exilis]
MSRPSHPATPLAELRGRCDDVPPLARFPQPSRRPPATALVAAVQLPVVPFLSAASRRVCFAAGQTMLLLTYYRHYCRASIFRQHIL